MTLPQCSETGYIHFLTASHTGLFCFFLLVHQYTSLPLPVRYKTTWPFSPILYCQKTENVRVDWQYTGSSVPSFGFQPSTDVDEESGICMLYKHTQISSRLLGSLAPIRCHFFWKSRSIKTHASYYLPTQVPSLHFKYYNNYTVSWWFAAKVWSHR